MKHRHATTYAGRVRPRDATFQMIRRIKRRGWRALLVPAMVLLSADAHALTADFVADRTLGTPPFTVSFTDTSSGTPTGWAWYFGDAMVVDGDWMRMTDEADWPGRRGHAVVALSDGNIVLMGGGDLGGVRRDVWRSTDQGVTWTEMTRAAPWWERANHAAVALSDGSIVLMGGYGPGGSRPDVWRSTDQGASWLQMTSAAAWAARSFHAAVALPDGSIVLMGGYDYTANLRDVWRSTDLGATWTQMTSAARWTARRGHAAVALSDGSIVLMGGYDGTTALGDVWRSTDQGATWTEMTSGSPDVPRGQFPAATLPDSSVVAIGASSIRRSADRGATWMMMPEPPAWQARTGHAVVALPDGELVMLGGESRSGYLMSDVWSLDTVASTEQNPEHTYEREGVYTVALQVKTATGFDAAIQDDLVAVTHTPPPPDITAAPTAGAAPLTVQFAAETSAGDTIGWAWYFGDDDLSGRTWTRRTASAGWSAREDHAVATLPDGSVVLMGGWDGSQRNDVWRSMDQGATWTETTGTANWPARTAHAAATLPDGSLVLMGGDVAGPGLQNDVWRSADQGTTWTQMTAAATWPVRSGHTAVALADGSLVLMGGEASPGGLVNDVWHSTDQGSFWLPQTTQAAWPGRRDHAAVALHDGSLVIMGGMTLNGFRRDVWRSADQGATWTQMTDAAPWSARDRLAAATLPDDSILILGGRDSGGRCHDIWRSTDQGATWALVDNFPAWTGRAGHAAAVLPDGSITLLGGLDAEVRLNDVWRLTTAGSTAQHPEHTYTTAGAYSVALQAYSPGGYSSIREPHYIAVALPAPDFAGTPTEGPAPLEVAFTDQTPWPPTGWAWYFGDEDWHDDAWTLQTAEASWSAREGHRAVALPDGNMIVMGGRDTSYRNDIWRSTDQGDTWEAVTLDADWRRRGGHAAAALPDGSLVVMGGSVAVPGGQDGAPANDVWRSTDQGATWEQRTVAPGWAPRMEHAAAVLPDGSFVVMGGTDGATRYNDVWRSIDKGASWTCLTPAAEWSARSGMAATTLPDGSLVLMGGFDQGYRSDVWRSTDQGATWTATTGAAEWSARSAPAAMTLPDGTLVVAGGFSLRRRFNDVWYSMDQGASWSPAANADWSPRSRHQALVLPDGSIVVLGGHDGEMRLADVWRLPTAGSTAQHPIHVYDLPGDYPVTLQAYRPDGFSRTRQAEYIAAAYTYPIVEFFCAPTLGQAPLDVQFNDGSKGDVTGWAWYFGDETLAGRVWSLQTDSAGWAARRGLAAAVLLDGSVLVMGGGTRHNRYRDVWRSTDRGETWAQQTATAGWSERERHAAAVLPDGSVLLTGGVEIENADAEPRNDVWRSIDRGATWTQRTGTAAWPARWDHAAEARSDGVVLLMGGTDDIGDANGDGLMNDVWMSTDKGLTWHSLGSADWSARSGHAVATLADDTLILAGGLRWNSRVHALRPIDDVWRSGDGGATWIRQTASAGWPARSHHAMVALPDDSLVLMGGHDADTTYNDVWRSTDRGETWTQLTDDAAWSARAMHAAVVLSDGSVALLGGDDGNEKRDVWRLITAGATQPHPLHQYADPGVYNVTLQAYNPDGVGRMQKEELITVSGETIHTLVYAAGAGGSVDGVSTVTQWVPDGEHGENVFAEPDGGAQFIGWCDGETANPRRDLNASGDLAVTALFASDGGVPITWYALHGLTPDEWENWHDLDLQDSDGDGTLNWEEYVADTDPVNPNCFLVIVEIDPGPPVMVFFEPASVSREFILKRSDDVSLGDWEHVPGQVPEQGTGGLDVREDDSVAPARFYRIEVQVP